MLFSSVEIQETVDMFLRHKLDVRAITMGISLLDCASSSVSGMVCVIPVQSVADAIGFVKNASLE